MVEVTKEYLDDIFASVDAAEGNSDRALNSCDEEDSDLDVPKPLPPPTQPSPAPQAPSRGLGRPALSSSSAARAPLRVAPSNRISAEPGRGGRIVYQTHKATGEAHYFIVQW